jgi:hypothetical protein
MGEKTWDLGIVGWSAWGAWAWKCAGFPSEEREKKKEIGDREVFLLCV